MSKTLNFLEKVFGPIEDIIGFGGMMGFVSALLGLVLFVLDALARNADGTGGILEFAYAGTVCFTIGIAFVVGVPLWNRVLSFRWRQLTTDAKFVGAIIMLAILVNDQNILIVILGGIALVFAVTYFQRRNQ